MISREDLHPFPFICSRSEPFRPEEQILSAEGEIFLLTNLVTPLGNEYMYQLIWSSSVLQLLSKSRLLLQLSSVRSAIWLNEFGFETAGTVQIWIISTFYALFFILNLLAFTPMRSFSDLIYRSLCVLVFYREPFLCSVWGAVPPPEQSGQHAVPLPVSRWREAVLG